MFNNKSKKISAFIISFVMILQIIMPMYSTQAATTQLIIKLTDKVSGASLANAQFTLQNNTTGTVYTFTTASDGTAQVSGLPSGTYSLKETVTPTGYIANTTVDTVTIDAQGYVSSWTGNRITNAYTRTLTTQTTAWSSSVTQKIGNTNWASYMNALDYVSIPTPSTKQVEYYVYLKDLSNVGKTGSGTDKNTTIAFNGTNLTITSIDFFDVSNTNRTRMVNDMNAKAAKSSTAPSTTSALASPQTYPIVRTGNSFAIPYQRFSNDWGFLVKITGTITDLTQASSIGYNWTTTADPTQTSITQSVPIPAFTVPTTPTALIQDILPLGKFQIKKTDETTKAPLQGAKFTLSNGTTLTTDSNGIVNFTNLQPGTYTLRETTPPTGYQVSDKTWTVTVYDNGVTSIKENISTTTPIETSGRDITYEINLTTSTIKMYDGKALTSGAPNPPDGKISLPSEDGVEYTFSFSQSNVNPGDYFDIQISDTIHYNMIQPDKVTYPDITDAEGNVIAVPQLFQSSNLLTPTKVLRYTFTDAVAGASTIAGTATFGNSVNYDVVQNDGTYTFSYKIGNNVASTTQVIDYYGYYTSEDDPLLTVDTRFTYANDQIGNFSNLVYVNQLGNNLTQPITVKVQDIGDTGTYFNPSVTNIKIYEITDPSLFTDSITFMGGSTGVIDVTKNFTPVFDPASQFFTVDMGVIGTKRYIYVIDGKIELNKENLIVGAIVKYTGTSISAGKAGGIGFTRNTSNGAVEITDTILEVTNALIKKGDFVIAKLDGSNEKTLTGAEFTLTDVNGVKTTYVTGTDGRVSFTNILPGTYTLSETKAPTGFQSTTETWKVTVDNEGVVTITEQNGTVITELTSTVYEASILTATIKNYPKANLSILKVDSTNSNALQGTEFTLTNASGAKTVVTTGIDGKANFTGLIPGKYTLTETKTTAGYQTSTETYDVVVAEDGLITITEKNGTVLKELASSTYTSPTLNATIQNYPLAKVDLTKLEAGTNTALSSVEFSLIGETPTNGTAPTTIETTGTDGKISFTNLAVPSSYYLRETKVLEGYKPLNYQWLIKVVAATAQDNAEVQKLGYKVLAYKAPLKPIVPTTADGLNEIVTTIVNGVTTTTYRPISPSNID